MRRLPGTSSIERSTIATSSSGGVSYASTGALCLAMYQSLSLGKFFPGRERTLWNLSSALLVIPISAANVRKGVPLTSRR